MATAATQTAAPLPTADVPDVEFLNESESLVAGETLKTFSGTVNRTGLSPVVEIVNSTITQSGATNLLQIDPGSSVSLNSPLLEATNSTLSTGGSIVKFQNGTLTSSTTEPFLNIDLSNVTSAQSLIRATAGFGLSLAGPLLEAEVTSLTSTLSSTLTVTQDVVGVFNGATVTSKTASPLIQLTDTSLSAGTSSIDGRALNVSGTGGTGGTTFASVSLKGPLLSASNESTLTLSGGLVGIFAGGQVTVTGSTDPLVSITGETHSIATNSSAAMFQLVGRSTATTTETVDLTAFGLGSPALTLGTDTPLQHGGPLLETSGATVSGQKFVQIDTALLQASAPLLSLKAGSNFTTTVDALDLSFQAKVTSLGPVIKLDASTLTVTSGALINLAGGSFLKVTGDLLQLSNGSTLNINGLSNGFLITAAGGSVLNVSGALATFSGTGGNSIVVKNNVAPTKTLSVGGVSFPILLTSGATSSQVSISGTPIKGSSSGSITFSNSGSLIKVDGTTAKVTISGF